MLTWRNYIEEILEFIHPYFCKSSVIFIDNLPRASWKRVGCSFPKHMSNMWASNNLQSSSTLPNLETAAKKTRFKHWQLKKKIVHIYWISRLEFHRSKGVCTVELLLHGPRVSASSISGSDQTRSWRLNSEKTWGPEQCFLLTAVHQS